MKYFISVQNYDIKNYAYNTNIWYIKKGYEFSWEDAWISDKKRKDILSLKESKKLLHIIKNGWGASNLPKIEILE